MKPLVYIETTIPSYYCSEQSSIAADIARTKEWWDHERDRYDCFISVAVMEELADSEHSTKQARLELVRSLPFLDVNPEVSRIAEVYEAQKLMPKLPVRDALHVAIASYYRMDYLLTWNCKHIANANKIRHLEVLNQRMGLAIPILTTPHNLQIWEDRP